MGQTKSDTKVGGRSFKEKQGQQSGTARASAQASSSLVQLVVTHAEDKVDHDGSQQGNSENRRSEAVVETALPPPPNTLRAPVKRHHGVDHGCHGNDSEQGGRDATDTVTKVEETHGQTAEDDGEVEP